MFGLTTLGAFHTAVSLIAVFAGFAALARYREISTGTSSGRVFFWGTVITCLTGFGIFRHGGFGNPHILGIVELAVLGVAVAAERRSAFGRASRYVGTLGFSLALFLHFIPASVETLTRLPAGAPYLANADDPKAQPIIGVFFVIFLIGATLQALRLQKGSVPLGLDRGDERR